MPSPTSKPKDVAITYLAPGANEMRTLCCALRNCLILVLGFAGLLRAQENANSPHSVSQHGPSRVYVEDFKVITPEQAVPELDSRRVNAHDVAHFTASYIRLRLMEASALEVKAVAAEKTVCGGQPRQGQENPNQATQVSAPAQYENRQGAALGTSGEQFFLIRGSVRIHPDHIDVDYFLERCDGVAPTTSIAADSLKFPVDRSNLVTDKAIEQLNILSQILVYTLGNPPTIIAVREFKGKDEKLSADLTRDLKRVLRQRQGFKLSEVSENPEYTIDGVVSDQDGKVKVSVQLHSTSDSHAIYQPVEVTGTRKRLGTLKKSVARSTSEALSDVRLAQHLGGRTLSEMDFDDLMKEGKYFLCMGEQPFCRQDQDPSIAVRVFREARKKPSKANDWNVAYYFGMAQAANYNYADAIKSLSESLNDIASTAPKGLEAGKAKIEVHNALGDVYAKYGDAKAAAHQYGESLKINPDQAELYVKRAEALFEDDRPGAIKVLLDGLRRKPAEGQLHSALLENIRRLGIADSRPGGPIAEEIAAAFTAGLDIRDEYALLLILQGETRSVKADKGRQLAAHALRLQPRDEQVRAEAYGLGASLDLPGKLDEADKLLAEAEALPKDKLNPDTLNWLARLRSIYFLDRKDYQAAYDQAKKAEEIDANSLSTLLRAQVAVYWADALRKADPGNGKARELYSSAKQLVQPLVGDSSIDVKYYYIKSNHGLGLDQESRQSLEALLKDNPKDISVAENLMFVCTEFLFDFDCGYSVVRKLVPFPKDDLVLQSNAVEAAVLKGDYQQASAWLGPLLSRADLDPSSKALARFYKFWISLVHGQAEAKDDFQRLQQSLTPYAQAQQQSPDESLSLQGARKALTRLELAQEKQQLLGDLISVLEDPNNPDKGVASIKPVQKM